MCSSEVGTRIFHFLQQLQYSICEWRQREVDLSVSSIDLYVGLKVCLFGARVFFFVSTKEDDQFYRDEGGKKSRSITRTFPRWLKKWMLLNLCVAGSLLEDAKKIRANWSLYGVIEKKWSDFKVYCRKCTFKLFIQNLHAPINTF